MSVATRAKFAATFAPPVIPNQLPYDMPAPTVGQIVLWYANASPSVEPVPCVVMKVHPRHCKLSPLDQRIVLNDKIMHAEDPGLQNPNVRSKGCWDFSPEHYRRQAWEGEVNRVVAELADGMGLAFIPGPSVKPVVRETPEERARKQRELEEALGQDHPEDEGDE